MTDVPLIDLQARLRPLRTELMAAFERVLDSGVFVMGPEAEALEREFAQFCGVRHAVAVNNGTSALQLALAALGIGQGDRVITVSHTFIATVEAISATGATPVLVDIDPATYLMDPRFAEAAITPRTRAIIAVHLYGQPCDMDAINAIAGRHGLRVIEDACQAHGARYRGKRAGALSDVACFSFYPAKNLGTTGEGGMLVTNEEAIARNARLMRSHGEEERYVHRVAGWNFRMPELLAAATRAQLPHLDDWNEQRRAAAAAYDVRLRGLPLGLPFVAPDRDHVFHQYIVECDGRDAVRAALARRGIGTAVHYPLPVHRQRAYASLGLGPGSLPVTERVAERILSLPMFPEISDEQIGAVAEALAAAMPVAGATR